MLVFSILFNHQQLEILPLILSFHGLVCDFLCSCSNEDSVESEPMS